MYSGIDTIYLVHHSHTDIGYTHDQPIVWDLHRRFIETAIDECERTPDSDADHALRWTVETTAMLQHWLETASPDRVARFVDLANRGRIEVTGMALNITPLYDTDQVIESLQPIRFVREELGLPVRSAMNSDVNGENWPLVDALLDAGIEGFSMATNIHFGGSPLAWPNAFRWEGPSGRSILAWNGWDYGFARGMGIGEQIEQFRDTWWPKLDAWLRQQNYPLPALLLQLFDRFGDNGPACPVISDFVKRWNETEGTPRLRIALPSEWWDVVRQHENALPTYRGDWTDYWNFGAGSSAREVAINRASRIRLRSADAVAAAVQMVGQEPDPVRQSAAGTRDRAWRALNLWDEHTWGADCSVFQPYDEDTASQWHHKANHAYTARSLSTMLARDAIANLARHVQRSPEDDTLVFNPVPFPRTLAGFLPSAVLRRIRGRADDPTAARHSADRAAVLRPTDADASFILDQPMEVPAFGCSVVPASSIVKADVRTSDETEIVTGRHHVSFDQQRGGIRRWRSAALDRELVDGDAEWTFGNWVHETPIPDEALADNPRRAMWIGGERHFTLDRGWQPGWAALRQGPSCVVEHAVEHHTDGVRVRQRMELPTTGELVQETFIPEDADWIESTTRWTMGFETSPEATYIAFPFAVPNAAVHLDLGGQAMHVDAEQLPRACRDYFTIQNWVDFSNDAFGVTVASPDAPLIQLGDFTFGANRETVDLSRSMLLGWVTNNYWETNFRAHQPGMVQARYRLLPHAGAFDESAAHRFGQDAATPFLFQHLHEPPVGNPALAPSVSLLQFPQAPVVTLHVWSSDDAFYLRLLNASDAAVSATLGSGAFRIVGATRCDLFGNSGEALEVTNDAVTIPFDRRQIVTMRLALMVA